MSGDSLRDALRYWEPRRLWYNVALSLEAVAWVVHPSLAIELRQPAGDAFVYTVPLQRAYAPCTTPNTTSWTGIPACAPPVSSPCE